MKKSEKYKLPLKSKSEIFHSQNTSQNIITIFQCSFVLRIMWFDMLELRIRFTFYHCIFTFGDLWHSHICFIMSQISEGLSWIPCSKDFRAFLVMIIMTTGTPRRLYDSILFKWETLLYSRDARLDFFRCKTFKIRRTDSKR